MKKRSIWNIVYHSFIGERREKSKSLPIDEVLLLEVYLL